MAIIVAKRLLTIDDYNRMAETGILSPEERVELLNGEIYKMSPIGSEHSACVNRLNRLFNKLLAEKAIVSVQNPVQIPSLSEPEPDIALLYPRTNFYSDAHPLPHDILLIIEVADSSIYKDQKIKGPIYAAAGIPEYWIVNPEKQEIEVYRNPSEDGYAQARTARKGEPVHLAAFGVEIRTEDVMGEGN